MALAEMPVVAFFGVFDQYQWKIRLHYLAMGTEQTKILSHQQAKKTRSLMTFLPSAKSETILFSRSGRKKKNPASRMTFLAALKSETRLFLRLALLK